MIVLVAINKWYEFKLLIVLDTDLDGSGTIKRGLFPSRQVYQKADRPCNLRRHQGRTSQAVPEIAGKRI